MAKTRRSGGAAMMALPAATLAALGTVLCASPAQAKPPVVSGNAADLRIAAPLSNEVVSGTFMMNVDFTGKASTPITVAEMWVDGERWARQGLNGPRLKGRLQFDVDATTLKPGTHTLMVRVYAEDGTWSSITTQIVIAGAPAASPAPERIVPGGPELSFKKPGNGNRVQGIIEIEVDAPARGGVQPYVSFYVDKQWKTLKNFPPYTFSWDTTTVPNGYHTIEAMGYLETTNATSTRKMQVFVDNPGGNTIRMTDIPDLTPSPRPRGEVKGPVAPVVKPVTLPGPATSALVPFEDVSVASVGPSKVAGAERRAESVRPVAPISKAARKAAASGQMVLDLFPAEAVSSTRPGDQPLVPVSGPIGRPSTALPPLKPGVSVAGPLRPGALAPVSLPSPAPRSIGPALASDTLTKNVRVAFDGHLIAFDVAPRVENGLPLAPFRQIFEHTGGQVMWVPQTRVVRAVNTQKEVILKVGQDRATVNGTTVMMDRASYIEKGRTIVPLSFVGQALDVDVQYDPATGRLQIKSKN